MEKWFAVGNGKVILLPVVRAFLWGILAGFTLTATLLLPGWRQGIEFAGLTPEQLREVVEQRDALADALEKQNKTLAACTEKLSGFIEGSTILYEAEPPSRHAAAVALVMEQLGTPLPAPPLWPRWVLPWQVTPILVGPSRGEVFYHVPPGGAVADRIGPFTPKTHEGEKP